MYILLSPCSYTLKFNNSTHLQKTTKNETQDKTSWNEWKLKSMAAIVNLNSCISSYQIGQRSSSYFRINNCSVNNGNCCLIEIIECFSFVDASYSITK